MTEQPIITLDTVRVYDLLPEFDSYMADVEGNLQMDARVWKAYQKNPGPAMGDVLMDFGKAPAGCTIPYPSLVKAAIKHYLGK